MKWMENYTKNTIDARAWTTGNTQATEWHVPDFTLYKANGEVYHGAEKAWEAIGTMFAPFQAHLHEPEFCVCWEREEGGWDSEYIFIFLTFWVFIFSFSVSGRTEGN